MNLFKQYKSSEYIFLFSILVLSLLLGTYLSFYAFLWRDIKSNVNEFNKTHPINYHEGMKNTSVTSCQPGYISCSTTANNCIPTCIKGNFCDSNCLPPIK